jgi:hypothetical protein
MIDDDMVEIYIRPVTAPAATFAPNYVRIAYGKYWVDFRGGEVVVSDDATA